MSAAPQTLLLTRVPFAPSGWVSTRSSHRVPPSDWTAPPFASVADSSQAPMKLRLGHGPNPAEARISFMSLRRRQATLGGIEVLARRPTVVASLNDDLSQVLPGKAQPRPSLVTIGPLGVSQAPRDRSPSIQIYNLRHLRPSEVRPVCEAN